MLEKQMQVAHADQHAPGARPPHRRPRPAGGRRAAHAPRARPGHLRAHHLGPRPRVPHRRPRRPRAHAARRHPPRAARRLLPHDRHRVHAHPGARPRSAGSRSRSRASTPTLDPTSSATSSTGSTRPRRSRSSSPPSTSARSASASTAPSRPSRSSTRCSSAAADAGLDSAVHGHGPPRPAQRARQHRRQALRAALQGVRGQRRPRVDPGLGRREVPPRPDRQVRQPRAATTIAVELAANPSHLEAVDPVVDGMARAKHGPHRAARALPGAADPHPRRRRVRRPGRRGRDAQPVARSRATGSAARST